MNILPYLFIPAIIFASSPIPATATPGLKPELQALSDRMQKEATRVDRVTIDGEEFTMRAAGKTMILYNSHEHVLLILFSPTTTFDYSLSSAPIGFMNDIEPTAMFPMDGKRYFVKVARMKGNTSFVLCDGNQHPFFKLTEFIHAFSPTPKGFKDFRTISNDASLL